MLFLNCVLLSYKTWYKQLQYVMFCSIIKELLSPVKYVSFVYSWCLAVWWNSVNKMCVFLQDGYYMVTLFS
jgi:hypothetical protein